MADSCSYPILGCPLGDLSLLLSRKLSVLNKLLAAARMLVMQGSCIGLDYEGSRAAYSIHKSCSVNQLQSCSVVDRLCDTKTSACYTYTVVFE